MDHHDRNKVLQYGCWKPPPNEVLMLNTDGSSRGNPRHVGIGGVDRDSYGVVQFYLFSYKGFHTNIFMESFAILYVLEMCYLLA